MIRVRELLAWIDGIAPFRYAASWDNCGLQVGDPEGMVEEVLVALDPSSQTLAEALRRGCRCVITHHPLLFRPIKAVRADSYPGSVIFAAIRGDIHLIAAHTNLDAALEGTNGELVRRLSLGDVEPLEVEPAWKEEGAYGGMGRIGSLPRSVPLQALVVDIRNALGSIPIRVVGEAGREVRRVAICTGSGGSLLDLVVARRCDVYVTGDVKYHEAQLALEAGLAVIDVGHFASERLIVEPLAAHLRSRAAREGVALKVFTASEEQDPFWTIGDR